MYIHVLSILIGFLYLLYLLIYNLEMTCFSITPHLVKIALRYCARTYTGDE